VRVDENPETLDEALAFLEHIRGELEGSPYATRAGREFQRLLTRRERIISSLLRDLDDRAEEWIRDNRLLDAATLYERYEGPYRERIRAERLNRAADLRRTQAEEERARIEHWTMLEMMRGEIAALLIEGRVRPAMEITAHAEYHEALSEERAILAQVTDWRALLMAGLRARVGRPIRITVDRAEQAFRLHSVSETSLFVEERVSAGILVREYSLQHLPAEERDRAMEEGGMRRDALALIRGMEACAQQDYDTALDHFRNAGVLAPFLEEQIRTQGLPAALPPRPSLEEQAETDALRIMQAAGFGTALSPSVPFLQRAEPPPTPAQLAALRAAIAAYRDRYGRTRAMERYGATLAALDREAARLMAHAEETARPGDLREQGND